MDEIKPKKRNVKPEESSNLPMITLGVLVFLVVALLYVGYEYITNDTSSAAELTNVTPNYSEPEEDRELIAEEVPLDIPEPVVPVREEKKTEKTETAKPAVNLASIGGIASKHTVKAGETFNGIASRYNLNVETLKALNPEIKDVTKDLKAGVTGLNIKIQAVHTVGPGDVLRVVASKYGITKAQLMQANGKTRDYAQRGEKLIIPLSEKK